MNTAKMKKVVECAQRLIDAEDACDRESQRLGAARATTMSESKAFAPDWISPPGDTIADLLEENEWQQSELADRTGYTRKHVNDLIKARVAISVEAAERLATVFGTSVEFWVAREMQYRAALQRRESLETRKAETP